MIGVRYGIDTDSCNASGDNPEQQVIHQEVFNRMLSAITRLTSKDRELITLVATADLTYREIGQVLRISEANVKVRVHRARTKLREIAIPTRKCRSCAIKWPNPPIRCPGSRLRASMPRRSVKVDVAARAATMAGPAALVQVVQVV